MHACMPLRAFCHKCGAVLYEGVEIKAPNEIISEYDGKCPKCGRKLSFIPKIAEIRAATDINKVSRLGKRKRK